MVAGITFLTVMQASECMPMYAPGVQAAAGGTFAVGAFSALLMLGQRSYTVLDTVIEAVGNQTVEIIESVGNQTVELIEAVGG